MNTSGIVINCIYINYGDKCPYSCNPTCYNSFNIITFSKQLAIHIYRITYLPIDSARTVKVRAAIDRVVTVHSLCTYKWRLDRERSSINFIQTIPTGNRNIAGHR